MRLLGLLITFVFLAGVFGGQPSAQTSTITVTPSTTYQVMRGLGGMHKAGQNQEPGGGVLQDNPDWDTFKTTLLDQLVNDLGVSQVRVEIRSNAENTRAYWTEHKNGQITGAEAKCFKYHVVNDNSDPNVINPAGFQWDLLDEAIVKVVNPLRALMAARGELLHVNLCYVSWTVLLTGTGCPPGLTNTHNANPAEYAEFVLAAYQHIQSTYGWVPDTWTVMLEPNHNTNWTINQIGPAIVAAGNRLSGAGFTPRFVVPENATRASSITWFDVIDNTAGVVPYLDTISFHTYNGWNDQSGMAQIATRANTYGIKSAMLEHIGATMDELHFELKHANISSFVQYVLASECCDGHSNRLFAINGTTVSVADQARYFRQYFRYVRPDAIRIGSSSTNSALDPLAFKNVDDKYVVVTKATGGSTFTIGGLPAGTYGIYYTTASAADVALNDQTITTGQNISTSIPAAGAITVYAKTAQGPTNVAPTVSAGVDKSVTLPATMSLDGTVDDDGLPAPPAATTVTWSKMSGPGTVNFNPNANTVDVTASFSVEGTYVLRLLADDGDLTATDTMTATVNAAVSNQAPAVNAGSDQIITLPASATLDGTVTDDGLPSPPALVTTTWSKFSGPGTVAFGNANPVDTTASFSAAGTYVLRLTANDSILSSSDDVTITVNPAASGGFLSGSVTTPTGLTDLTLQGTSDWAHWGLVTATSFNNKSGVTKEISNFTKIGSGGVNRYLGYRNGYSWTDGTPTLSATNSPNGVYRIGLNKGFQITLPADTNDKTLKLYVGAWAAGGRLEVTLSDGSAPPFIDTSLIHVSGANVLGVYILNYRAASFGQTLTIKWTVASISNSFGNVTLQAATLVTP